MSKSLEITKDNAMLIEGGATKPILVLLGNHIWNMVPSSSAPPKYRKSYDQQPLYKSAVLNWDREWMVVDIKDIKRAPVTFAEFESKYKKIRQAKAPNCTFKGCKNPIDYTDGLGWDTSCFYHRLLFDWWLYNVGDNRARSLDTKIRRDAFYSWVEKCGKLACDRMVLEFAQDPLNWAC